MQELRTAALRVETDPNILSVVCLSFRLVLEETADSLAMENLEGVSCIA